jgi:X-Pro dipeptidyl-peptidase (S15 family)
VSPSRTQLVTPSALRFALALSLVATLASSSCGREIQVAGPRPADDEIGVDEEDQPTASNADASAASTRDAAAPTDAGSAANPGAPTTAADAGPTPVEPPRGDAALPPVQRPPATSLALSITREGRAQDQPVFNLRRPADLTKVDGPLPVILWANGDCLRSDAAWSPLLERWASAGFVVLSLYGGTDDQGLVGFLASLDATTTADHAKLIDWVVAQNKSGPYAGKLDLERIAVAGASCGGATALKVASSNDRVAAVFVLAGSSADGSANAELMKSIRVPVGYLVGGSQDAASADAAEDYAALSDGVPAMIVSRRQGTVSTGEKVLRDDAEIALNWLDLALSGTQGAYDALKSANVCEKCTPGDWSLKSKHLETLLR